MTNSQAQTKTGNVRAVFLLYGGNNLDIRYEVLMCMTKYGLQILYLHHSQHPGHPFHLEFQDGNISDTSQCTLKWTMEKKCTQHYCCPLCVVASSELNQCMHHQHIYLLRFYHNSGHKSSCGMSSRITIEIHCFCFYKQSNW